MPITCSSSSSSLQINSSWRSSRLTLKISQWKRRMKSLEKTIPSRKSPLKISTKSPSKSCKPESSSGQLLKISALTMRSSNAAEKGMLRRTTPSISQFSICLWGSWRRSKKPKSRWLNTAWERSLDIFPKKFATSLQLVQEITANASNTTSVNTKMTKPSTFPSSKIDPYSEKILSRRQWTATFWQKFSAAHFLWRIIENIWVRTTLQRNIQNTCLKRQPQENRHIGKNNRKRNLN